MGYLEQFARNTRRKEKSEVLTARLPQSLYSEFKAYCDELGLSISEAVYLLVEREMNSFDGVSNELATTKEYIENDDVVVMNTETNTNIVDNVVKKKRNVTKSNTNRFTTKHWVVNGELPCPICNQWASSSNFARHAKQHDSTTQAIFTNEEYLKRVKEMIEERNTNGS
jgi:antitoxin component of RelBE/YafQ-DinJ toxin-antitoxin module